MIKVCVEINFNQKYALWRSRSNKSFWNGAAINSESPSCQRIYSREEERTCFQTAFLVNLLRGFEKGGRLVKINDAKTVLMYGSDVIWKTSGYGYWIKKIISTQDYKLF